MEFIGARVEVRTPDGWLVGFDGGEWGGGLYWFNATGTRHYQIVTDKPVGWFDPQNVRDLLPFQGGVLAVQGLAHLGLDGGKVEKVTRGRDGKWKASVLVDLGSAPQVCLEDGEGEWIIFTYDGAVRVHADGTLDQLGAFPFAGWLYPNSLARAADGTLYVGMRHFVARLIPDGQHYRAELMVPTDLPLFDPDPPDNIPSGEAGSSH